jgi:hypothetical protein
MNKNSFLSELKRRNVYKVAVAYAVAAWSYDRKLTDIFAVESEIAKTIADTLQAKLTGAEKQMMAAQPTSDMIAYELYHKGRSLWERRSGDQYSPRHHFPRTGDRARSEFSKIKVHGGRMNEMQMQAVDQTSIIVDVKSLRPNELF